MSSLKNMFSLPEDYEEDDTQEQENELEEEDSLRWEESWEKMQETTSKEKRKMKTLKRLRANGEY